MDNDQLSDLANNPNFVEGIFNYCDRWCERCLFTHRCMNYAAYQEEFGDSDDKDITNEQWWEKFADFFRQTIAMVKEQAQSYGIDLETIDDNLVEEDRRLTDRAKTSPCPQASKEYSQMVSKWFDSSSDLFSEKADQLNHALQLQLPGSDPEETALQLNDAAEVIRWYQHQIHIKLVRATRGMLAEEEPMDYMLDDANGSAKVALIGIDRSIAAWGVLYDTLQSHADEILDILVHLQRLQNETQRSFPNARNFMRPGLDRNFTAMD